MTETFINMHYCQQDFKCDSCFSKEKSCNVLEVFNWHNKEVNDIFIGDMRHAYRVQKIEEFNKIQSIAIDYFLNCFPKMVNVDVEQLRDAIKNELEDIEQTKGQDKIKFDDDMKLYLLECFFKTLYDYLKIDQKLLREQEINKEFFYEPLKYVFTLTDETVNVDAQDFPLWFGQIKERFYGEVAYNYYPSDRIIKNLSEGIKLYECWVKKLLNNDNNNNLEKQYLEEYQAYIKYISNGLKTNIY